MSSGRARDTPPSVEKFKQKLLRLPLTDCIYHTRLAIAVTVWPDSGEAAVFWNDVVSHCDSIADLMLTEMESTEKRAMHQVRQGETHYLAGIHYQKQRKSQGDGIPTCTTYMNVFSAELDALTETGYPFPSGSSQGEYRRSALATLGYLTYLKNVALVAEHTQRALGQNPFRLDGVGVAGAVLRGIRQALDYGLLRRRADDTAGGLVQELHAAFEGTTTPIVHGHIAYLLQNMPKDSTPQSSDPSIVGRIVIGPELLSVYAIADIGRDLHMRVDVSRFMLTGSLANATTLVDLTYLTRMTPLTWLSLVNHPRVVVEKLLTLDKGLLVPELPSKCKTLTLHGVRVATPVFADKAGQMVGWRQRLPVVTNLILKDVRTSGGSRLKAMHITSLIRRNAPGVETLFIAEMKLPAPRLINKNDVKAESWKRIVNSPQEYRELKGDDAVVAPQSKKLHTLILEDVHYSTWIRAKTGHEIQVREWPEARREAELNKGQDVDVTARDIEMMSRRYDPKKGTPRSFLYAWPDDIAYFLAHYLQTPTLEGLKGGAHQLLPVYKDKDKGYVQLRTLTLRGRHMFPSIAVPPLPSYVLNSYAELSIAEVSDTRKLDPAEPMYTALAPTVSVQYATTQYSVLELYRPVDSEVIALQQDEYGRFMQSDLFKKRYNENRKFFRQSGLRPELHPSTALLAQRHTKDVNFPQVLDGSTFYAVPAITELNLEQLRNLDYIAPGAVTIEELSALNISYCPRLRPVLGDAQEREAFFLFHLLQSAKRRGIAIDLSSWVDGDGLVKAGAEVGNDAFKKQVFLAVSETTGRKNQTRKRQATPGDASSSPSSRPFRKARTTAGPQRLLAEITRRLNQLAARLPYPFSRVAKNGEPWPVNWQWCAPDRNFRDRQFSRWIDVILTQQQFSGAARMLPSFGMHGPYVAISNVHMPAPQQSYNGAIVNYSFAIGARQPSSPLTAGAIVSHLMEIRLTEPSRVVSIDSRRANAVYCWPRTVPIILGSAETLTALKNGNAMTRREGVFKDIEVDCGEFIVNERDETAEFRIALHQLMGLLGAQCISALLTRSRGADAPPRANRDWELSYDEALPFVRGGASLEYLQPLRAALWEIILNLKGAAYRTDFSAELRHAMDNDVSMYWMCRASMSLFMDMYHDQLPADLLSRVWGLLSWLDGPPADFSASFSIPQYLNLSAKGDAFLSPLAADKTVAVSRPVAEGGDEEEEEEGNVLNYYQDVDRLISMTPPVRELIPANPLERRFVADAQQAAEQEGQFLPAELIARLREATRAESVDTMRNELMEKLSTWPEGTRVDLKVLLEPYQEEFNEMELEDAADSFPTEHGPRFQGELEAEEKDDDDDDDKGEEEQDLILDETVIRAGQYEGSRLNTLQADKNEFIDKAHATREHLILFEEIGDEEDALRDASDRLGASPEPAAKRKKLAFGSMIDAENAVFKSLADLREFYADTSVDSTQSIDDAVPLDAQIDTLTQIVAVLENTLQLAQDVLAAVNNSDVYSEMDERRGHTSLQELFAAVAGGLEDLQIYQTRLALVKAERARQLESDEPTKKVGSKQPMERCVVCYASTDLMCPDCGTSYCTLEHMNSNNGLHGYSIGCKSASCLSAISPVSGIVTEVHYGRRQLTVSQGQSKVKFRVDDQFKLIRAFPGMQVEQGSTILAI